MYVSYDEHARVYDLGINDIYKIEDCFDNIVKIRRQNYCNSQILKRVNKVKKLGNVKR